MRAIWQILKNQLGADLDRQFQRGILTVGLLDAESFSVKR
jgi:hypothetical protein